MLHLLYKVALALSTGVADHIAMSTGVADHTSLGTHSEKKIISYYILSNIVQEYLLWKSVLEQMYCMYTMKQWTTFTQ